MHSNDCLESISSTHHASCCSSSVLTNFFTHFHFKLTHSSINVHLPCLASLPDQTLLPSLLESCIDPRSALQLLRLLGCVTAVCVEDWLLDGLSHPHTAPSSGDKMNLLSAPSSISVDDTATTTAPSSSSVHEVSCVEMTDRETAHLDTTASAIIPTSDIITIPVPANENATSDSASTALSTVEMWGRDEILSSLPWLRWRGVALTPAADDSSQPHVSPASDISVQRHPEHLGDTVSPGTDDVREKEVKKRAATCSKLSCAQTEHTTQYRDEELEREVDIALSRRIGKPGLKSASRGGAQAARDAPCVLRRKVVPRSGPNRSQAVTDRQVSQGEGPNMGAGKDHGSLQEGLAQMLAANRDALMEKRTYSMINRKPSLRNQMLARKGRHSHSPQQSDAGEGSVLRIGRNYNCDDMAVNGETGNGNGRSSTDSRPLLKPLRKSFFQVSGPSLEFNPNDFVTTSTAIMTGVSKKSDIRALGPGRIRGDWISALIAGGPPPGTKKRADPGPGIPKLTSAPCTVAATSLSLKKKSSRDHNEDDFTAVEDGSELNLSTAHSSHDPPILSAVHTKSILEGKPPLAFNVSRHQHKGRMKIGGGNNPLKRSSHGTGKPIRYKEGDRSAEKNTDLILAPTVKKKRPSDDGRAQFPVPPSQPSLPESKTGVVAGTGRGAEAEVVAGASSKDSPLNSFTPWRSGNQDSNGGSGAGAGAKRVRHNPEDSNLIPLSAAHGTSSGPHPSLSSTPATVTGSKSGTRFPPTFKVHTRPPPTLSQTSALQLSMNQEMKDFEQHNWSSNNYKMDIEEPYVEGSGIPCYPRIPSDDVHRVMPHIDNEEHVDDHSTSPSSKPLSPSYTQSGRDGKCLNRRDGIPTARSMNSTSVGGVIVSGTLQRAKPGPKPRLQFTSDGDSNTVRKRFL